MSRTAPEERRNLVSRLREAAADAGDARLDVRDGRFVLTLEGSRSTEVVFSVQGDPPFGVDSLDVRAGAAASAVTLTRENLAATFDRLEAERWSGVVHVTLGGAVALERPFGMADAGRNQPVTLDTVFGTGSRPIDYTIAAVNLLAQQGRLKLDDTIDTYFDDVPADKHAMTIRHLMTGQSGLPDFFHTRDDWDPDLAWVDRATAERRMMAQPLLFAPGQGREHSHGAFGLLAALVERVSGDTYARFIRQRFFEPAGMTRTGFYGESLGLSLDDFAIGAGPSVVGVPNIPPNWGPTSWLVMGSGGMYSTLPDLRRFYALLRSGRVLDDRFGERFRADFVSVDGSDRGFELFHVYNRSGNEAILMLNMQGNRQGVRQVFNALVALVEAAAPS
jgi:CubicO group peptidase (beta-lactamase class C family)